MPFFHLAFGFLKHWLYAVNEHSLHAPFIFDFYTQTLRPRPTTLPEVEALRKQLLNNHATIPPSEFGAGYSNSRNSKSIANLAATGLSKAWFSSLYYRIIEQYECKNIIELGTSFGINTCYLATPEQARVTTFEGHIESAQIARRHFEQLQLNNKINLIEGDIRHTLQQYLEQDQLIDFAFIDANHQYQPTLDNFEKILSKCSPNAILVLDDIHWSKEMTKAWKTILDHPSVVVSIDLFYAGILFLNPEYQPSNYKLSIPYFKLNG